ncbi:esterase/lipase [Archangium gephyra]|uniref:Esterase/lipase n=1 Tax=Archangium gephyra TaxID=48 RepID=A0AAC8QIU7_9BACT|nr:alpha/beta fold hydrolase [Archangium gephyra]AKJ07866.1 Lipase LipU [Archangium gephyra]REG29615.1 esterase/lipase [Archangium gephyra]
MDPEKTAPFELGRGEDACLLLHGFTGSPWDVRPLGEALAARGLYVRAPQLPGHGSTPEALLSVSHRDWERAAAQALLSLRGYRRIFVAGLSMGALLSLRLAADYPEQVHGLALVAPALRFQGPHMWLLKRLRRHGLLERVKPWVFKTGTDVSDPAVLAEAPILPAFPSARLQDLWELQDIAMSVLPRVRCPALVAVAEQDHVVDPTCGPVLVRGLTAAPHVRFISLSTGFHIIPRDKGGPLLASEVGSFFARLQGTQAAPVDEEPSAPACSGSR